MRRIALLILVLLSVGLVTASSGFESTLLAQDGGAAQSAPAAAPANTPAASDDSEGKGFFVNPFLLLLVIFLFCAWVYTTDWIGQDCPERKLSPATWVVPNVFVFGLTFWLLCAAIPFFLGYLLAILAWAVPLGMYIKTRNALLDPHERVMTKDHIRYVIGSWSGGKVKRELKEAWDRGPEIQITAMGADASKNTENLYTARKMPDAYVWVKELIYEMIARRASKVMMDYTKETVAMRYLIDGVWLAGENRDRESSDQMLAVLKLVCNLNPNERRARQSGEFEIKYDVKKKVICSMNSQGTQTGERVLLAVPAPTAKLETFEDLGMREGMIQEVKGLMGAPNGLFVFTARPEGGFTTLWHTGLSSTDRLMRDFAGIELKDSREPEVMNIALKYYDPAAGQKPEEVLTSVIRNQPDALFVRRIDTPEVFNVLLDQANGTRMCFTTVNAKEDCAEAVLRLLSLKVPADEYASALNGVLYTRLCRRLCKGCREEFQPSAALLKRLGIPPDKVDKLYKTPTPPGPDDPKKPPCEHCGGIGYYGRVGIFELMKVDDGIRRAIVKTPKLEAIRAASKQAGNKTLQEEAIRLVATGVTSLEEISRVLKE
ncbi:Type II secretion system protein E [Bremerella volcania]|uniref:Type II secretion system protein E n=1 Tax=Bremerella volcania TaxID=2527984 RepID=A0A518C2F5_9BACT|nr:ATPase, T2SS/T4P/T4SS family [Bremerella volcania]QDU73415.1 Type II secretion system protein E [Bremerella volcania]